MSELNVYKHIRYATAGRFCEPELIAYNNVVRSEACACPQNPFRLDFIMGAADQLKQSEDCLFMNIYTPVNADKLPVMVWFHGGAYIAGSSEDSAYNAESLAAEGNIIVVTVSYRLGVFGYLHNEPKGITNLGLKDQITALRWVQRYIGQFGGDKHRVTIAGQSAGGHSVATIIANTTEPLFSQAIVQSAPLGMQTDSKTAETIYRQFCKILGKDPLAATTDELLNAQRHYIAQSKSMMPFSPLNPGFWANTVNPHLKRVFITYQQNETTPFVALALHHERNFGSWLDWLAAKFSSQKVFVRPNIHYADYLRNQNISVTLQCLDWQPAGSPFGACHCLELSLLFGSWQRWQGAKMLGNTTEQEWRERATQLRHQWAVFVKG